MSLSLFISPLGGSMSPNTLMKAGVSPVLCLIWLCMLLFTGCMFAGLIGASFNYYILDLMFFKPDVELFGQRVLTLLTIDVVFYSAVYFLFMSRGTNVKE